jgi:hypothetical protein
MYTTPSHENIATESNPIYNGMTRRDYLLTLGTAAAGFAVWQISGQ